MTSIEGGGAVEGGCRGETIIEARPRQARHHGSRDLGTGSWGEVLGESSESVWCKCK